MLIDDKKFYGSTTVGEKGQVVLPADLRHEFNIKAGDKLAVMVLKKAGFTGIVMVEANIFTSIIEKFFGGKVGDFLTKKRSTEKVK